MYFTALLALFLVVSVVPAQCEEESRKGYHELVGIPAAKAIKEREDRFVAELQVSRIFKGEKVPFNEINKYPFHAGLIIHLVNGEGTKCGSSLLNNDRLVTAAHCWDDGYTPALSMTVVLGSPMLFHYGERHETSHVVVHPQFDIRIYANDIAIIYLPNKVTFSAAIFPIALPEGSEDTIPTQKATVIGTGATEIHNEDYYGGPTLRRQELEIISNEDCKKFRSTATPKMICTSGTGGIGPCFGDSGGPLYVINDRKFLVGIVSHGSTECGFASSPTVYTRVASYLDFIKAHVKLPQFSFHIVQQQDLLLENITVRMTDNESGQVREFCHFSTFKRNNFY